MPFVSQLASRCCCSVVDPLSSYRKGLRNTAKKGMVDSRQSLYMLIPRSAVEITKVVVGENAIRDVGDTVFTSWE